jgi:hypothetical protein
MVADNSDHANNRGLDRSVCTRVYVDVCPCLVASSGAQIQQEQQSEQQQQARLAQHSLVRSGHRGKT